MAAAPSTGEAGWLFQQSATEKSSMAASDAPSTQKKKKRTQPDPDAEVIALSPKTLMATNRFICEVCKKGFQREQNLQLHKRGHNLPWKLKQRSTKEIRKKVYLCPEPSCIHHNPSRALGDLTGIKKHFFRKHGEKKWRCEKCSKRYAVQSDWKAHSKTCGTKEYRCDCGTLFSRRDSFVTHRAFCDALAQENVLSLSGMTSQLFGHGRATANQVSPQNQGPTYHEGNTNPSNNLPTAVGGDGFQSFGALLPPLGGSASTIVFGSPNHHEQDHDPNAPRGFFADIFSSDNFKGHQISPLYSSAVSIQNNNASTWAHLSATALLQKAAQVGSSCSTSTLLRSLGSSFSSSNHDFRASLGATNSRFFVGGGSTNSSMFGYSDDPHKNNLCNGETKLSFVRLLEDGNSKEQPQNLQNVSIGGCDRLTRDFLGVGQIVRHMSGGFAPNDLLQHQQGHQMSSKTSIGGVWTSLKDRITR